MRWLSSTALCVYTGLIEFAREFDAAGVELLTVTLVDPPGAAGIEQLEPLVCAFA